VILATRGVHRAFAQASSEQALPLFFANPLLFFLSRSTYACYLHMARSFFVSPRESFAGQGALMGFGFLAAPDLRPFRGIVADGCGNFNKILEETIQIGDVVGLRGSRCELKLGLHPWSRLSKNQSQPPKSIALFPTHHSLMLIPLEPSWSLAP
jgi:hypothetical protein